MDIYNSDMCRAWHARNPNWNIFEMSPFRMLKWHWQSLYLQSKCNCQVSVLPCFNACYYFLHIAPHCTLHTLTHTHTLATIQHKVIFVLQTIIWWWYSVARLKLRRHSLYDDVVVDEKYHIYPFALKVVAILSAARFGIRYISKLIANASNVTEHIINW